MLYNNNTFEKLYLLTKINKQKVQNTFYYFTLLSYGVAAIYIRNKKTNERQNNKLQLDYNKSLEELISFQFQI